MARDRMSEAEREVIREWLRGAIGMSGLSPSGLAKRAGVSQTTVTRFLANSVDYAPSWSTIGKLAAAAKVQPISPGFGNQFVKIGPTITIRKPTTATPISSDAGSLVPEDLSPDEYLTYLLSFRRAIDNLYVRLTHGSYKYPEVAENIAQALESVAQLDAWLHTLYKGFTPHRAAQQPTMTSSSALATAGGEQQPRSRRGKTGKKPKTEVPQQDRSTYA
jgi:transcriptional regulator with XRE-family HTH domain